jgi:carbon monoxide dehydrogenase subunit G
MKPMLCTHTSSAPPDRVWAVASDFANAAGRITGITKIEILTPGPVGAGTRFREWRGRQVVDMEIAAWSPPRSYSLRGYAVGTEFTSEIRCVPDGSGTRLEMEIHARPQTFGARLLSPLISLMSKVMVKSCAKDLADIAAAAERGDARATLPSPGHSSR